MPGPAPLPTKIKEIRGTLRKERTNPREPELKAGRPRRPSWLTASAIPYWSTYVTLTARLRVLTPADGIALGMLAMAHAEYVAAIEAIQEHGATYESSTPTGHIIRARPEVAQASDAWRRVNAGLQQFGLSPSSRSRVNAAPPDESDDPVFKQLFGDRDPLARFGRRERSA